MAAVSMFVCSQQEPRRVKILRLHFYLWIYCASIKTNLPPKNPYPITLKQILENNPIFISAFIPPINESIEGRKLPDWSPLLLAKPILLGDALICGKPLYSKVCDSSSAVCASFRFCSIACFVTCSCNVRIINKKIAGCQN